MVPFCHHLLMCNFFHFIKTNKWKNPSIHLSLALPPFPSSTDRQVFIWASYICYFYFLFFIVRSTLLCTFISYWTADLLSQMSLIICFFFGKYNVFLFYFSVAFLTVHHFLSFYCIHEIPTVTWLSWLQTIWIIGMWVLL